MLTEHDEKTAIVHFFNF